MRTLALDVGTKTIGVAVSDELSIAANGVTTIRRTGVENDLSELKIIVGQYKPSEILVGLPLRQDGSISKRGQGIFEFAEIVKEEIQLDIKFWDESYSTVNAETVLLKADVSRRKRKKVIDRMAAVCILQEYLSSKSS